MSLGEIIKEIENLSEKERVEVYYLLREKMIVKRKEHAISFLNSIMGSGKGVWNMDAQEFVNQLRADDRS